MKDKLIQAAWERGDLRYLMHEGQRKIWEHIERSKTKEFVINCSRQYGKSRLGAIRAVSKCLQNPKYRVKYASAFRDDLKEYIIPHFQEVLEDCPDHLRPTFSASQNKFIFPNGSEIKLLGLDKNPNGLRGNKIDEIFLDECGYVSNLQYLHKSVIIPATTHRPKAKVVFISTPPISPDHYFTELCQKAEQSGHYSKFTVHDNPLLTKEMIEELCRQVGGETSTDWKREYLCEFVVDENLAIVPEWRADYEVETPRPELYSYFHKYTSLDLGVRDFTAALFAYYDFPRAKLVIENEYLINGPKMTTDALADSIRQYEKETFLGMEPYLRVSDNNNLLLLNDLSIKHKLYFMPTSKDSLDAMVNNARLWVRDGRVEVNPRCKQLIGCLRSGIWMESRRDFAHSAVFGHFDALAALIYLIRNVNVFVNPVPEHLGKNAHTHFIPFDRRSAVPDDVAQLAKSWNIKINPQIAKC